MQPAPAFTLEILRERLERAEGIWKGARRIAQELAARGSFTPDQARAFVEPFRNEYAALLREFSRRVIDRR